jgi:4-amino-4-deoxy-L-arabinose transferase-like glycosyltransferase
LINPVAEPFPAYFRLGTPFRALRERMKFAGIFGAMLLAALLGLFHLASKPLWNDEAFSFFVSYRDLVSTLHFMRQDTQPPVYYLLLTAFLRFGHGPGALRGISVLAIVVSVPLLYDAGRTLLDKRTAWLACLLFVLDSNVVLWEQRARPYAVQTAFIALAMWGFARIWMAGRKAPWPAWAAWVLGGALALLTQYPAGFFLLGANLAIAARIASGAAKRSVTALPLLWRWTVAQLAMIALWLPFLPSFLHQFGAHLTPEQMAAHHPIFLISARNLLSGLRDLLSIPTLWRAQLPFALLYGGLAIAGTIGLRRRRVALPILGIGAVPLIVCVAAFALLHPVFGYVTLTFIWLLLPYSLLIATGVMSLPRAAGAACLAMLLVGNLWGLRNAYSETSPPLDRVAATISAQRNAGDRLLLSRTEAGRWALAYYLGPPYARPLADLDMAGMPAQGWLIGAPAPGMSRLWLVLPDGESAAVPGDCAMILQQRFASVLLQRCDRRSE